MPASQPISAPPANTSLGKHCGLPLLIVGVVAHLILGVVAVLLIISKGWWLVFPALFFLIAWQALYRQRSKTRSGDGSRNLEPDPEKLITDPEEIRRLDEQTRVK